MSRTAHPASDRGLRRAWRYAGPQTPQPGLGITSFLGVAEDKPRTLATRDRLPAVNQQPTSWFRPSQTRPKRATTLRSSGAAAGAGRSDLGPRE